MQVIGIGGGSGTGKSSVSNELMRDHPEQFEVLCLDDYQRPSTEGLPLIDGLINWDHPDIFCWQVLRRDIETLRAGRETEVQMWGSGKAASGEKSYRLVKPHPVLVVEGVLALNQAAIDLYDKTFYLDLAEENRLARRRAAREGRDTITRNTGYIEKVLIPMHQEYVEPTRANADFVIDVSNVAIAELAAFILEKT